MGVDAEMFARIRPEGCWLKPENELRAAVELAATFGANHFLITDEYHALEIVKPYGTDEYDDDPNLKGKVVWQQDGPEIVAGPDEQFVKVHLFARYYGPDYPRGDWLTIQAVAEWLELNFAGCEVWYGGDSSGICAERFDREKRREFHEYFLARGRRDYWMNHENGPECVRCKATLSDVGGGQGVTFYSCNGCGRKYHAKGGEIRRAPKHELFPSWDTCKPIDQADWHF